MCNEIQDIMGVVKRLIDYISASRILMKKWSLEGSNGERREMCEQSVCKPEQSDRSSFQMSE